MSESVSVVLPVHNIQAALARQVSELLELLADLTNEFEVLIVDDGSTDFTYEVGLELSQQFPQVQVVRLAVRMGTAVAVRTGIQRTAGDIILVQDQPGPLDNGDVRRLWELRNDPNLVMARADGANAPINSALIHRLSEWNAEMQNSNKTTGDRGGIQMIRRQAIHRISELDSTDVGLGVRKTFRSDAAHSNLRKPEHQVVNDRLDRLTRTTN